VGWDVLINKDFEDSLQSTNKFGYFFQENGKTAFRSQNIKTLSKVKSQNQEEKTR